MSGNRRNPNEAWGQLLVLSCVLGCAPSPEVVQAGAGRATWDRAATRTPPPPDGDDPSEPPPPGGDEVDADVESPPDADVTPPISPDAARMMGVDAGARDSAPMPPPNEGPPQTCTLTFQVTTVTFNGSYAPRNVGAIWVSDAAGKFVRSLTVWAGKRMRHLVTWEDASSGNTVDAVTSATANSHSTRTGRWNCTGLDHQPVADGNYRINVEFTERNSLGKVMTPLTFTKGPAPVSLMPADQTNFRNIRLQVTTP